MEIKWNGIEHETSIMICQTLSQILFQSLDRQFSIPSLKNQKSIFPQEILSQKNFCGVYKKYTAVLNATRVGYKLNILPN